MLSTKCFDKHTTLPCVNDEIPIFLITHVLGKDLTTADALSRVPLTQTTQADEQLTVNSVIYVSAALQNLPVTDKCLVEIQKANM